MIKEWHLWLEGALHPFTVLTDHRNLEYIRQVKCLNPRQARWALFFSEQELSPEPIIPSPMVVAPVRWDMDAYITCEIRERSSFLWAVPPGGHMSQGRYTCVSQNGHTLSRRRAIPVCPALIWFFPVNTGGPKCWKR